MEKAINIIILVIGVLANIVTIVDGTANFGTLLLIICLCVEAFLIVQILYSTAEQKSFLKFIAFLYDNPHNRFNILPKICIATNQSKANRSLHIRSMEIEYEFDFSSLTDKMLSANSTINYQSTISYRLKCESQNLPESYTIFRGNMNSMGSPVLFQKHGSQESYREISCSTVEDLWQSSSSVNEYTWDLLSKSPSPGLFPINFKFLYNQEAMAASDDYIIFYPSQFASKVDAASITLSFLSDHTVLQNAELFRIAIHTTPMPNTPFHSSIEKKRATNNQITFHISPKSTTTEAFYIKLHFDASNPDPQ